MSVLSERELAEGFEGDIFVNLQRALWELLWLLHLGRFRFASRGACDRQVWRWMEISTQARWDAASELLRRFAHI